MDKFEIFTYQLEVYPFTELDFDPVYLDTIISFDYSWIIQLDDIDEGVPFFF